jgi:DUF2917 family protein
MLDCIDSAPVELPAHTIYCIDGRAGLEIRAVAGTVWVTQANDPRDIVLGRGRSFVLDRKGVAVAYALLDDAAIVVSEVPGSRFEVSQTPVPIAAPET